VIGYAFWSIHCIQYFHEVDNNAFRCFISKFVTVYFDNILISSEAEDEHASHLKQVIQVLEMEKPYGNLKKCTFFTHEVTYLRYIVTANGIQVDENKVEAIRN